MADAKITCPKCGGHIAFPKELAGQETSCPHCNESVLLPKSKPATAWIIAAVFALVIVCLASILAWKHVAKHDVTPPVRVTENTNSQAVVLQRDPLATEHLLGAAQSGGNRETINLLLEKGADINAKDSEGWTPLHHAARSGNVEIIKLLLEKGADVNAKRNDGETALMLAAGKGQTDAVKLLLDKGANINSTATDGMTALMLAAGAGKTNAAKFLLDKGADINAKDTNGTTALMFAAVLGQTDVVELLLEKRSDVNAKQNDGITALMLAVGKGQTNAVKLLLDKSADINTKDTKGETALMLAAGFGQTDAVELLLEKGADINAKANDGTTVLMWAAGAGNIDVVKLLLAGGADINAVNPLGLTALVMARERGNAGIVQLLKQSGATDLSASGVSFKGAVASDKPAFDMLTHIDPSTGMPRWPTDGKITDTNLRVPISFTNSLGDFITDAIPTRLFANKLIYITAEGGGGTIRLEKLPPDLRERFGYDPEKAAQADEVDRQKHEAQLKRNKEAAYAAALAEYRQQIESSKMMIEGKVIQKLDIGLLVDSGTEIKRKSYEWAASVGAPTSGGEVKLFDPTTHLQIYNGLCLLTDYSKISSVVDGDIVRAVAYPNGEYSYTAVSGGSKTVRQFTCDINAVSKAPSQAELNQLKAWKPNEP